MDVESYVSLLKKHIYENVTLHSGTSIKLTLGSYLTGMHSWSHFNVSNSCYVSYKYVSSIYMDTLIPPGKWRYIPVRG